MNDSTCRTHNRKSSAKRSFATVALTVMVSTFAGCQGTQTFQNPFGGIGNSLQGLASPTRVPPPATGSFQVPGSYNNNTNGAAPPPNINNSSMRSATPGPNATGQFQPPSAILANNIAAAQAQLQSVTDNTRTRVQQTAGQINSSVEQASARIDRFGNGVVQASNILSEAAQPVNYAADYSMPQTAPAAPGSTAPSTSSGRISDGSADPNAAWRRPSDLK